MTAINTQKSSDVPDEIQLQFSDQAAELICELAKITGRDAGEVISDALGVYAWAQRQRSRGLSVTSSNDYGRAVNKIDLEFPKAQEESRSLLNRSTKEVGATKVPRFLGKLRAKLPF